MHVDRPNGCRAAQHRPAGLDLLDSQVIHVNAGALSVMDRDSCHPLAATLHNNPPKGYAHVAPCTTEPPGPVAANRGSLSIRKGAQGMKHTRLASALAALALSGAAQAELFDRGGGMIYDDTLNITWLSDWNYAQTSGFDADGLMSWDTANSWADSLDFGGYGDWRLSTALNADGSGPSECPSCGEMGHMFYNNWGATFGNDFSTGTNTAALALFSNVQSSSYWTGTEDTARPDAWAFLTFYGTFMVPSKAFELFAVAVREGDVTAVPEPETGAMMLLALGAFAVAVRRRPV
jgi:hypothetical protein